MAIIKAGKEERDNKLHASFLSEKATGVSNRLVVVREVTYFVLFRRLDIERQSFRADQLKLVLSHPVLLINGDVSNLRSLLKSSDLSLL